MRTVPDNESTHKLKKYNNSASTITILRVCDYTIDIIISMITHTPDARKIRTEDGAESGIDQPANRSTPKFTLPQLHVVSVISHNSACTSNLNGNEKWQ